MTATSLTRGDLWQRIEAIPSPLVRAEARLLALGAFRHRQAPEQGAARDPAERRAYHGRPADYFREVLGWRTITDDQRRVLDAAMTHDRVIVQSAAGVGKSFLGAGFAVYWLDVVGSLLDPASPEPREQGSRVLLPGPSRATIYQTIYQEMLQHAERAEARGHMLPGAWSLKSVHWHVRPQWGVEALAPSRRRGLRLLAAASGRHHRNMLVVFEEGKDAQEALWNAVENMASGAGNKVLAFWNPTESSGPVYVRSRRSTWRVLVLDALDHPNVRERRTVIPGAVSHADVDDAILDRCLDRGPFPQVAPDPERHEFTWALPPAGAPEPRPRTDGHGGHADGELRVWAPDVLFLATKRGLLPEGIDDRLFSAVALDRAVARWRAGRDPDRPPSCVGLDVARRGANETVAMARWGPGAAVALQAVRAAMRGGPGAVERARAANRIRLGEPRVLPKGNGPETARAAVRAYPGCPWNVDEGGVGAGTLDHMTDVMKLDAAGVSFGGSPDGPLPGEEVCVDKRTQMAVRFAALVALDLADVPDDPLLLDELLALRLLRDRARSIEVPSLGARETRRVEAVRLEPKERVEELLGRSPDRADGAMLAVDDTSRAVPPASAALPGASEGRYDLRARYGERRPLFGR